MQSKPLLLFVEIDINIFLPEHFIFKGHYNKPIFTVPRSTKAHTYSDSDEEGLVLRDSEAIKNKTSHVSAIVSKFPSRKKLKVDTEKET